MPPAGCSVPTRTVKIRSWHRGVVPGDNVRTNPSSPSNSSNMLLIPLRLLHRRYRIPTTSKTENLLARGRMEKTEPARRENATSKAIVALGGFRSFPKESWNR
mmetsp:Transcript_30413/g.73909  ORF Transcript_30413/g.73909 Transcript_30413/m.73909 type:complete len:103 (+) Transcript_30413:128-436(+)